MSFVASRTCRSRSCVRSPAFVSIAYLMSVCTTFFWSIRAWYSSGAMCGGVPGSSSRACALMSWFSATLRMSSE